MLEPANVNALADVESGLYEAHFKIQPGHLVLDLGAHVGHFAAHAVKRGAHVIAFEPHPENFGWLSLRILVGNAVLVRAAAWDIDCTMLLHECPSNSGAHSLFKHPACSDKVHAVKCLDIGTWLWRTQMRPAFIKIDTEGAEAAILRSLFKRGYMCPMAIEVHSESLYSQCRTLCENNNMTWLPQETCVGVCYAIPK